MKRTRLLLVAVVALQVLWIVATAITTETKLAGPVTVLLETRPVDPRDLLRGDYVILNYAISSVPSTWINAAPGQTLHNQPIYVTLQKQGVFHQAIAASLTPPENVPPNQIILRGTIEDPYHNAQFNFRVRYGIERYYVREGTGNPRGTLTVRCVVNPDHTPLIKQLYLNGQPYADAMRDAAR